MRTEVLSSNLNRRPFGQDHQIDQTLALTSVADPLSRMVGRMARFVGVIGAGTAKRPSAAGEVHPATPVAGNQLGITDLRTLAIGDYGIERTAVSGGANRGCRQQPDSFFRQFVRSASAQQTARSGHSRICPLGEFGVTPDAVTGGVPSRTHLLGRDGLEAGLGQNAEQVVVIGANSLRRRAS